MQQSSKDFLKGSKVTQIGLALKFGSGIFWLVSTPLG
jgi:hypothetical protein